jgi:hypothetical protein
MVELLVLVAGKAAATDSGPAGKKATPAWTRPAALDDTSKYLPKGLSEVGTSRLRGKTLLYLLCGL